MDKSMKQIKEEKEHKENAEKAFAWQIKSLNDWNKLYEDKLKLVQEEITIKIKAPLPIEPTHEFELLPEWKKHYAKSHKLALTEEKLKIETEIFDIKNRILSIEQQIEKLDEE